MGRNKSKDNEVIKIDEGLCKYACESAAARSDAMITSQLNNELKLTVKLPKAEGSFRYG